MISQQVLVDLSIGLLRSLLEIVKLRLKTGLSEKGFCFFYYARELIT